MPPVPRTRQAHYDNLRKVELAGAEAVDLDLAADLPEELLTTHLDLSAVSEADSAEAVRWG